MGPPAALTGERWPVSSTPGPATPSSTGRTLQDNVLIRAVNQKGDSRAVYRYFERLRPGRSPHDDAPSGPARRHRRRLLPDRGRRRPRRHGRRLPGHDRLDRPVALKLLAPDVADDEASGGASCASPRWPPPSTTRTSSRSTTRARSRAPSTSSCATSRGSTSSSACAGARWRALAAAILAQIASALDAAHAAGLVHRDVKPANILIAAGKGRRDDHAYLTDFGLTKQRGSQTGLTQTGAFLGTLDYIAPEQIEGKRGRGRADQYALAASRSCLTGRPLPTGLDVRSSTRTSATATLPALRRAELPAGSTRSSHAAWPSPPRIAIPTRHLRRGPSRSAGCDSSVERPVVGGRPDRRRWISAGLVVELALTAISPSLGSAGRLPGATPGTNVGLGPTLPRPSVAGGGSVAPLPTDSRRLRGPGAEAIREAVRPRIRAPDSLRLGSLARFR